MVSWRKRGIRLFGGLGCLVTPFLLGLGAATLALIFFRFVPLPFTPLMVIRAAQGHGIHKDWVALETLPEHVPKAFLASEDARFCQHWGIDFEQMGAAVEDWQEGEKLRGASTISMQTTKNVLLWPSRSYLRKGLELALTPVLELAWGKWRIAEVYLNVAELGPGVYGVEAAAQFHFGRSADKLSPRQASLLAAILPSPLTRSAAKPSAYVSKRARDVERSIRLVEAGCISAD